MSRWLLIRHGESEANAAGVLCGWLDADLSLKGEAQAKKLGEILVPYPIDFVLSSDLKRAYRTALIAITRRAEIRGEPPVEIVQDRRFRERNFGSYQGRKKSELRAEGFFEKITGWDRRVSDLISYADFREQLLPALREYSLTENPVLFAHGGVLRALIGPESVHRKVPNATIFERLSLSHE